MDEVINNVKERRGYRVGNTEIKIICYTNDGAPIAESEDDLQRLVKKFTRKV